MPERKLLPVRLRPCIGEHFSAYLLRLAIANGRSSVKELFSTLGIKSTKARNHQSPNTLEDLSIWLGLSSAELRENIIREDILAKIVAHDSTRIYRNLELRVPRICTLCIEEGARIPAYFGQLPFSHCLSHRHELIHACPNCQTPLEWAEELLECCCPTCHSTLVGATKAVTLPPYLAEIVARQSDQMSLNHYVKDLLLALQCVLEPLSSDLSSRERPPVELADWPRLFHQAYALLNDNEAITSWVNVCREKRHVMASIGTLAIFLPIHTLKGRLTLPWPLRNFNCYASEQSLSEFAIDRTSPLALIDHHLLSQVLGCESSEILPLIEPSVLDGISGHRSVRDARFDLSKLALQVMRLSSTESEALVDMERAASIAAAHGGHMGNVLAGVLLAEIPIKLKAGRQTLLDGAVLDFGGLVTYMARHFNSHEAAQYSLRATIDITGLSENEISQACALGLIKPQGWRRGLYFLGGDVRRLLSTHVSIKRWSKIFGVPTRQLLASLRSLPYQACIEGVLYERTAELDVYLHSLVAMKACPLEPV